MGQPKMFYLGCLVLLLAAVVVEAASTPPGIAKNPARSSCKKKEYKMCYNLEHVCPKFCPDSCETDCASCKPICTSTSSSEDHSPSSSSSSSSSASSAASSASSSASAAAAAAAAAASAASSSASSSASSGSSSSSGGGNSHNSSSSGYYPPPSPKPSTPPTKPPTPAPSTPTPPSPTTPSPSPPATPATPPSNVAPGKKCRCKNKSYKQCYNQEHVCPAACPTSCQVDCASCKPVCSCDYPGAVCQDPRFIGGDGITFYFHGKKDKEFCLVTDPNLHINAHFIGKRNANMGRDFTWVESIGIMFDNHRLFFGARKTSTWDDANDRLSLAFDGEPIFLDETIGSQWTSTSSMSQVTITRTSETNNIVVDIPGKLKITAKVVPITDEDSKVHNYGITDEDRFAHLDLGFKFYSLTGQVNGVLGKTYRNDYVSRVNMKVSMPVMGGEREYATSNIFATDCLASRFVGGQQETSSSLETMPELASMNCASGMNGRGVVCKR